MYHAGSANAVLKARTGDIALAVRLAIGDLLHLVHGDSLRRSGCLEQLGDEQREAVAERLRELLPEVQGLDAKPGVQGDLRPGSTSWGEDLHAEAVRRWLSPRRAPASEVAGQELVRLSPDLVRRGLGLGYAWAMQDSKNDIALGSGARNANGE